jgi:hypothetical protein
VRERSARHGEYETVMASSFAPRSPTSTTMCEQRADPLRSQQC